MDEKTGRPFLTALEAAGFEAYLVGGCVRDWLLGRPVHDLDITTNASPAQIAAVFAHTVPTGVRHGTVTAFVGEVRAEITTYRTEGAYLDARHPSSVQFVQSLEEDLRRRDFTINAMARDRRGRLVDLFGGQEDLRRGRIRCVGVPEERFSEDALRILRAVRFSAQLGFTVEQATAAAAARCAPLCEKLSAERVREELEKTLCSPNPARLSELAGLGILTRFGSADGDFAALAALPSDPLVRWSAWKRMQPTLDLRALRLDGRTIRLAEAVRTPCRSMLDLKRLIAAHGMQAGALAATLDGLDMAEIGEDCVSLAQLAVRGGDLPELQGRAVGRALQAMLAHVLEYPQENEKEKLLRWYFSEGVEKAQVPAPDMPGSKP